MTQRAQEVGRGNFWVWLLSKLAHTSKRWAGINGNNGIPYGIGGQDDHLFIWH